MNQKQINKIWKTVEKIDTELFDLGIRDTGISMKSYVENLLANNGIVLRYMPSIKDHPSNIVFVKFKQLIAEMEKNGFRIIEKDVNVQFRKGLNPWYMVRFDLIW